ARTCWCPTSPAAVSSTLSLHDALPISESGVADGYIVEGKTPEPLKNVISAAVRRGITAGEPITPQRLVQKGEAGFLAAALSPGIDRKSTRLNSSHVKISYAVFCLKKKI